MRPGDVLTLSRQRVLRLLGTADFTLRVLPAGQARLWSLQADAELERNARSSRQGAAVPRGDGERQKKEADHGQQ